MGTRVPPGRIAAGFFLFGALPSRAFNAFLPFGILSSGPRHLNSITAPTSSFPRKEVIQPHLPIRLPCYDFTPVTGPAFDGSPLSVRPPASGIPGSHGVTGGVYKTRERIHRGILIRDY